MKERNSLGDYENKVPEWDHIWLRSDGDPFLIKSYECICGHDLFEHTKHGDCVRCTLRVKRNDEPWCSQYQCALDGKTLQTFTVDEKRLIGAWVALENLKAACETYAEEQRKEKVRAAYDRRIQKSKSHKAFVIDSRRCDLPVNWDGSEYRDSDCTCRFVFRMKIGKKKRNQIWVAILSRALDVQWGCGPSKIRIVRRPVPGTWSHALGCLV